MGAATHNIPGAPAAPTWPAGSSSIPAAPADIASLWAHVAARTPVVLLAGRGAADHPAASASPQHQHLLTLTPAALAAAAGHVAVAVETRAGADASFGQGTQAALPFGVALARLAADHSLYLSAQAPPRPGRGNLPVPVGELALALATPSPAAPGGLIPVRPALAGGLVLAALNLWVGGAAAASRLHADAHDNLLGVVAGVKTVTLFPPRAVGDLATVGRPVRVWPNGRLVFAGEGEGAGPDGACEAGLAEAAARAAQRAAVAAVEGGGTDAEEEAALEAALEAGVDGLDDFGEEEEEEEGNRPSTTPPTFSRADLARPASVRAAFPAFPWSLGRTVALTPGQTLYIPAGWFHFVQSAPEKRGRRGGRQPASPSPGWAGLHCAVNHWFHPPDAADEGGPGAPYSRPYWAGVWAEALDACPRLRAAVEAQQEGGGQVVAAPPPPTPVQPPPPTPVQPPAARPSGQAVPASADGIDTAMALMRAGLTGLAAFDAGGRAALRKERRMVVLQALAGRRTRHGAGCALPWLKRRRAAWW